MKTKKTLVLILSCISMLATVFHFLILLRVIPFEITWGGRLKSVEEMYVFETISILINSFFIFILLQKGEFIPYYFSQKAVTIILWIFFILFTLNTIGNIFANTNFEKFFSLLTLMNSIFIWKINQKEALNS